MAKGSGGRYFSIPGLTAYESLITAQFKVVILASTARTVKLGSAASGLTAGILQNEPAANDAAEVACLGICKALAEASVGRGDHLACSTTGRVKTTTSANDHVLGVALEDSAAAGDLITIMLAPSNY